MRTRDEGRCWAGEVGKALAAGAMGAASGSDGALGSGWGGEHARGDVVVDHDRRHRAPDGTGRRRASTRSCRP